MSRLLSGQIENMYPAYRYDHPIIKHLNESLIGTRFYRVGPNRDLLGDVPNIIPQNPDGTTHVASYYLQPMVSTLVTLYDVEEPRVKGTQALTFTGHTWKKLAIQNYSGQPNFTVARPLYLSYGLRQFSFLRRDYQQDGNRYMATYQNNNVFIYVTGPAVMQFGPQENAYTLLSQSASSIVSRIPN